MIYDLNLFENLKEINHQEVQATLSSLYSRPSFSFLTPVLDDGRPTRPAHGNCLSSYHVRSIRFWEVDLKSTSQPWHIKKSIQHINF